MECQKWPGEALTSQRSGTQYVAKFEYLQIEKRDFQKANSTFLLVQTAHKHVKID